MVTPWYPVCCEMLGITWMWWWWVTCQWLAVHKSDIANQQRVITRTRIPHGPWKRHFARWPGPCRWHLPIAVLEYNGSSLCQAVTPTSDWFSKYALAGAWRWHSRGIRHGIRGERCTVRETLWALSISMHVRRKLYKCRENFNGLRWHYISSST